MHTAIFFPLTCTVLLLRRGSEYSPVDCWDYVDAHWLAWWWAGTSVQSNRSYYSCKFALIFRPNVNLFRCPCWGCCGIHFGVSLQSVSVETFFSCCSGSYVSYELDVWWALVKKRDYCNDITEMDFLEQLSLQKQFYFASAVCSSNPSVENNATPLKTKWGLFLLKMTVESIFLWCLLRLLNCCLILTSGLKAFQENKHM